MSRSTDQPRSVGIIANPMSGHDCRRMLARASHITLESKRDRVARAVVGAVAGGADRVILVREPTRISQSAVENLKLDAEIEVIDIGARLDAGDSMRAAEAMRNAGCAVLIVLGGDGTNRAVCRVWPDAPLVSLSTGTNNVFPTMVEATIGGAAAGLLASGRLALDEVAERAKLVHLRVEGEGEDLALVDVTQLVGDRVGNLMPFDPTNIRRVVLARAEPASVGTSSIGGLVEPCSSVDEFGVVVDCVEHGRSGQPLRVPISPGLYRTVHVAAARRIALGQRLQISGPAVLAFDGDREQSLADGQLAALWVQRDGPWVIDPGHALALAARRRLFVDRGRWRDAFDRGGGFDCC
jgi:predicted polyphosphate/ATP-dependent NAD kinase